MHATPTGRASSRAAGSAGRRPPRASAGRRRPTWPWHQSPSARRPRQCTRLRSSRGGVPGHGHPQRDAGLVLRRRRVVRARAPRSRTRRELAAEGAELIDVGGESTRPGAEPVGEDEELGGSCPSSRRWPRGLPATLSVDTSKAAVAARGAGRRGGVRQRRDRAARRPGDGRRRGRGAAASAASCTCSASRARCSATPATATWWTTCAPSWRSAAALAVAAGRRARAHPPRPRDRLRQDRRAQPGAPAPPGRDRRARLPGGDRDVAQVLPGAAHRSCGSARPGRRDRGDERPGLRARGEGLPGP